MTLPIDRRGGHLGVVLACLATELGVELVAIEVEALLAVYILGTQHDDDRMVCTTRGL